MNIFGREIHFFFSVGAKIRIGKIDKDCLPMERTLEAAVIMSEEYEKRQGQENHDYKGEPLTYSEVTLLSQAEVNEMCEELNKAFEVGGLRSVEAEENKKKEAGTSS